MAGSPERRSTWLWLRCVCLPCRGSGYSCVDWLWGIIMGLRVSRLPRWDDNHSGCPLISTAIGVSIILAILRDEREHCCACVHVNTCVFFTLLSRVCAHMWMFCAKVNKLSGRWEKKCCFFPILASSWVNLCFMEIKYHPLLPPCLQMVPVEWGWLSGPSEPGNLRVLMLGGQWGATPSLLSPGAWIRSPLPAPCLWSAPSLLRPTTG